MIKFALVLPLAFIMCLPSLAQQWFVLDESKLIEVSEKGITAYSFAINERPKKLNTVKFSSLGMEEKYANFSAFISKNGASFCLHHSSLEGFLELSFTPQLVVKGKIGKQRSGYFVSPNFQAPDNLTSFPVPLYNEQWLSSKLNEVPYSVGLLNYKTNEITQTKGKSFSFFTLKQSSPKLAPPALPSLLYIDNFNTIQYAFQSDTLYLISSRNLEPIAKFSIGEQIVPNGVGFANVEKLLFKNGNFLFLLLKERDKLAQLYKFSLQSTAGKPIGTLPVSVFSLGVRNGVLYYFDAADGEKVVRAFKL